MAALAQAFVSVKPDLREFDRDLQRGMRGINADKAGKSAGRKFGGAFSASIKGVIGGVAVLGAFTSATGFLKAANAEARESVKVGKVTAQIIKSTGGAAKITSSQVSALATSISNATGKDDELVQSGANLLLTFKNVRNEVGKGNQIFNRATAAAVDLSATGFGSVEGASKMLGKALNDPVKGITALQRAGVTFSDQQKKQIKVMVEAGDVLGAQKLIMKEVESQVGGVAAASASASEKYAVASGNFKELVGNAIKPATDGFYNAMTKRVLPALSEAVTWLEVKIPAAVKVISPVLAEITGGFRAFGFAWRGAMEGDPDVTSSGFPGMMERLANLVVIRVLPALRQFGDYVRVNVLPVLRSVGQFILTTLLPAWLSWYGFLIRQMLPILRQVGGFVVGSVVPAFRTVARFIASDVVPGFLSIVETVKGLIRVVAPIIGQIVGVIIGQFTKMRPQIQSIWGSVKEIITGVMFIVKEVVQAVTTIIRLIWDRHGEQIKKIVGGAFGAIFKIVAGVMKAIAGVIKLVVALIKGDWSGAWNAIKQIFSGVWQAIRTILGVALRIINANMGGFFTTIKSRWSTFWTGIKTTTGNAMGAVHTKITGVLDRIKGAFQTAKTNIGRVWDGVKSVVQAPITWIKDHVYNTPLVPVWNRVAGLVNGPKLATFAKGGIDAFRGILPGYTPGRDTHLIAAGGGEAVMRPEWTKAAGAGYVNAANKAARSGGADRFVDEHGLPGFAGGGIVGWIKDKLGSAGSAISGLAAKIKGFVLGSLRSAAGAILNPLKGVIDRSMPGNGVGKTVGGIGKKGVDLLLAKIGSADSAATAITGGQGITGPVGGMTSFRGGRFTSLGAANLRKAEQIAGVTFRVMQGGWRPATSYSGTSHAGDAVDTQASASVIRAIRAVGWASGDRTGLGNWGSHAHSVPSPSTGRAGGSAVWQYQDYLRRGGASQGLRSPWGLATGGKALTAGWATVGERGPELIHMNKGDRVTPLGRGDRPININIDLGDGVTQRVQGVLDEHDEFRASVGRMR